MASAYNPGTSPEGEEKKGEPSLGDNGGSFFLEGIVSLTIKKSGIEWFDTILENDQQLKEASNRFDLVKISARMKELREIHNVKPCKV